jgi:hypothetical protein
MKNSKQLTGEVAGAKDEDVMAVTARKNQPVFVVGCHRSGTALFYDSLLSAGGFPLYHAAPFLHSTLLPMSGDPSVPKNRKRMM